MDTQTQAPSQTTTIERVAPGWKVVGSDDKDIGQVSELGINYFGMTKGLLLTKTLYVPFQYIAREDDLNQKVYLRVGKDVVDSMGWDNPPGTGDVAGDESVATGSEDRADAWRMPR